MVISNFTQVGEFVVVNIHSKALFNLLLNEVVDHGIRFPAAGRTQNDGSPERVDHVNPSPVFFPFVSKQGWQVHRILILHQSLFLHKRFVLAVEHILHQVIFQQAAYPGPGNQHQDKTCRNGQNIQG